MFAMAVHPWATVAPPGMFGQHVVSVAQTPVAVLPPLLLLLVPPPLLPPPASVAPHSLAHVVCCACV